MEYTPFDPTMKFNVKLKPYKQRRVIEGERLTATWATCHIESESGNPKNRIISKAVNISHNQPIREGYLKSGT